MKKIVISLFTILSVFVAGLFAAPISVKKNFALAAEERYSRVLGENVILYMDSSMTMPWFTLPYSYYVKVISVSGTAAKVEYRGGGSKPSAKGYIDVSELNIVEETPPVIFPNLTLTVNQNCMLYKDTEFTIAETVTQNSTADFYGILVRPNGEKFIYSLVTTTSGDKYVGYMSINAVSEFTIPVLKVETEMPDESLSGESDSGKDNAAKTGNGLQLAIIIAVSAVAISIVYLLFRPSGKGRAKDEAITSNEFDDNDY